MKYRNQIESNLVLAVNGGLGNQLFQVAAALNFAEGKTLSLSYVNGNASCTEDSVPEVFSFLQNFNIEILQHEKRNLLVRKLLSLSLLASSKHFENSVRIATLKIVGFMLNILRHYSAIELFAPAGIGFDAKRPKLGQTLVVGYFQSYRWANETKIRSILHDLKLKESSSELLKYVALAEIEKPLIVHIRLGDYRNEPSIGILTKKYYKDAISLMLEERKFTHLWVFSDDLKSARELIGNYENLTMRWIPNIGNSSCQTLELMRYGSGYVIANSTFSWWGAFLRYNHHAKVIAPTPWFKWMESPVDLLPTEWTQISR